MRTPPALLALTPGRLASADFSRTLSALHAAARAGLRGVLVREPGLPDGELLAFAREVTALLREYEDAWIGIHDRVHVALATEADAVHLGFRSLTPVVVRELVPETLAVGLSTHAGDDTERWRAADYVFHGPVHATPSKEGLLEPIGAAGLQAAVARSPVPVLGIGGLGPEHGRELRAAGALGMAVLRGILGAEDPGGSTERYLEGLRGS